MDDLVEIEERYDLDGNLILLMVNGVVLEIPEEMPQPRVLVFNREIYEKLGVCYIREKRPPQRSGRT
jgi:hypothetical protein